MIRRLVAVLLIPLAAAGCADMAGPSPAQPAAAPRTMVTADPPDARCRVVGVAARRPAQPAPMWIEPTALGLPVSVTCEKPGFQPTTEVVHPRPAPSLLKALAAGAKISPMVDDSAPAGAPVETTVPAAVVVRLRPALFTTASARDAYYERLRAERQARWQALSTRVEAECRSPDIPRFGESAVSRPAICQAAFDALAKQRGDDLRQLEFDRRRSTFR